MNTTNYTANTYTAAPCAAPQPAARASGKQKIPGRKGAIARLAVVWIFALVSFCSSFFTIPEFAARVGLGRAILEAFAGFGVLLLTAAMLWGVMKFIGFAAPKTFRAAKNFWRSWIALSFFGLYIKFAVFSFLTLIPIAATFGVFSGVIMLIARLAAAEINVLTAFGLLLLGTAGTVGCSFWDLCKLRQVKPMAVLGNWISRKGKR